ncbi:unnamed protein product [Anisakis simplex]|uniref:SCP domain-containing protein n=1 Tax=Anisakis simplex TaxID=6269 RepID=A0A0M3K458_ANISI|nr:unnamed protein product [Anisakis simplex]
MLAAIVLLGFLPLIVNAQEKCKALEMNDKVREFITDQHNQLRSKFALGNGYESKPAKNMYQLKYDCQLENEAQKLALTCDLLQSLNGVNYFLTAGPDADNTEPEHIFKNLLNSWISYIEDNEYTFSLTTYQGNPNFPQMVWGSTTRLGCALNTNCTYYEMHADSVVCRYEQPGNVPGEVIYEAGDPCKQDSDCTTYPGSKCLADKGLCVKP